MSRHNSSHRDRERSPCRRSSSSQDSSDSSAHSNPKSKLKTSSVDEEQSERDRRRREMRQHSRIDSNGANDLPNSSVSMTSGKPVLSIQMKLNPKPMAIPKTTMLVKPRPVAKSVASAFSNDSDDEVEEMPAECRMRMRNIGRDTPTSSGPNSFGKTKQGFVDVKKIFEKQLKNMTEND